MSTVLITGTSSGIGKAAALKFLDEDHKVIGIDINEMPNENLFSFFKKIGKYEHYVADISDSSSLPDIKNVDILVCNAGVQTNSERDIDVNLKGTINTTEKYGVNNIHIKSILIVASTSATNGVEFPYYSASKGGLIPYAVNTAKRVAAYGATCNTLSPGGVLTLSNNPVVSDPVLWRKIMDDTPLKRWAKPEEIAEWIYFLTVCQTSMTGQDVVVDLGERINQDFYWKN